MSSIRAALAPCGRPHRNRRPTMECAQELTGEPFTNDSARRPPSAGPRASSPRRSDSSERRQSQPRSVLEFRHDPATTTGDRQLQCAAVPDSAPALSVQAARAYLESTERLIPPIATLTYLCYVCIPVQFITTSSSIAFAFRRDQQCRTVDVRGPCAQAHRIASRLFAFLQYPSIIQHVLCCR